MTSSGGDAPRPDETDASDDFTARPWPSRRGRGGQGSLWQEERDGAQASAAQPTAGDVWSRDYTVAAPADAGPDAVGPAAGTGAALQDVDIMDGALQGRSGGMRVRRVAWELLQTLVLAALIFLMVRGVAQNFRVEGPSMEPGLHDGQYLLVNKAVYFKLDLDRLSQYLPFVDGGDSPSRFLFHGPERGDVVVFRYPNDPSRDFIKRVIGVPGDTVEISAGVVSVNGGVLQEPYVNPGANTNMEGTTVPQGSYFVLGDNRPNSSDSRNWGFVPEENIIGKAMFSYWPLSEFGGVGNTNIDLGFVKIPLP